MWLFMVNNRLFLNSCGKIKLEFASGLEQGNFGDLLSRYIVEKLSGLEVVKYNAAENSTHITAIGSVLDRNELCSPVVVWGSGFLSPQLSVKFHLTKIRQFLRHRYGKPEICAVRGLKTAEIIKNFGIECPNVYGDPALLMPSLYRPQYISKKHKLGVVLHWRHAEFKEFFKQSGVKVIDIQRKYEELEKFIDEVLSCEVLLSSSLHGLIIANAYKVPCVRLKSTEISIHNKREREDFKFEDYLSGLNSYNNVNEKKYDFPVYSFDGNKIDIHQIVSLGDIPKFEIAENKLLDAFPLKLDHKVKR